jgi:DNA polymerase III delta prime subunit
MNNNIPLVDKYRPKHIQSIVNQDEIKKVLLNTLETGNLPNFIFYGPPGTGKTSAILALAYQLFGPKLISDRVLELNASDERRINVVREKIIKFAKESISESDPDYPSPPYKIIILDEADAITLDAQSALRKVIESTSKITRFCFTCNYIEKIIEPIISRCVKFRFKPLSICSLSERLSKIAELENIKINKDCIKKISEISGGDGRKAIMILQNCKYIIKPKECVKDRFLPLELSFNKPQQNNNIITIDDCDELTGTTNEKILLDIYNKLINSSIYEINDLAHEVINHNININNLLRFIKNKIINSNIQDNIKSKIVTEILNIYCKLIEKADEFLQILFLFTLINCNIKN